MVKERLRKLFWIILIILGIINITKGMLSFFDPFWIGDIFFGGTFIILGIWWYVDVKKLDTKPAILSTLFFGISLILLATYRASIISDLSSTIAFLLGTCVIFISTILFYIIYIKNKIKIR